MPQPFPPYTMETTLLSPWQEPLATATPIPSLGWEPGPGGGALWRRLTACYAQLQALPRRLRRALQRKLALPLAGIALLLALGQGSSQAGTIWTVCASGCDYTSIKAAIAAPTTLNGDTLTIAAGTYTEAGLVVNKSLTLQGKDADTTIVQAAATAGTARDRVVTIAPRVTVTIQGLTVQHGVAPADDPGPLGGGLLNQGTLTLINSTISSNSADAGGLANSYQGTAMLINSTVRGNSATVRGGGVYNAFGMLTLINSTISGNSAENGGGLANTGRLTLINSTVSGNLATARDGNLYTGNGGGVYNEAELMLINSTISGNLATARDGNLYTGNGGGLANVGNLTLTNSLVASNPQGGDCANFDGGSITSQGYNLDSDGSCSLTAPTDRPGVDPLLGPLQDNGGPTFTQALLPGSPALDAIPWGTNGCGTTLVGDQRWQARPHAVGGSCDIGAYEVEVAGQPLSGWVTGLTPETVTCKDVTTGQVVTLNNPATSWDCEAAGVAITSGDQVSMRVQGPVEPGATDVGGAVTGMAPSSGGCTNLTTGQSVQFQHMVGATAASCVAAGLAVHAGDTVQISAQGAAE
jgi:hypothetical protein